MLNRKVAAWCVHLYTAIGGVIGVFALFSVANGNIREAFLLLVVTMLIDSTDGMLARRVNVSEVLPNFDGAMMDNMIDTLTFGWIPIFIMYQLNYFDPILLILPTMALLYAYAQPNMKSEESFFLGFPSYWNIIALYLFWLSPNPALATTMIIVPTILTFIPTRYLYPSKNRIFWKTSWGLGAIWFTMAGYLLLQPQPDQNMIILSLFYPIYYLVMSFYVEWKYRRGTTTHRQATSTT